MSTTPIADELAIDLIIGCGCEDGPCALCRGKIERIRALELRLAELEREREAIEKCIRMDDFRLVCINPSGEFQVQMYGVKEGIFNGPTLASACAAAIGGTQ